MQENNKSVPVVKNHQGKIFVLSVAKGVEIAHVKTAYKLEDASKKEPPRLLDADKNPPKPNVQNDSGHPAPSSTFTLPQSDQKSKKYISKSYKVSHNKSFKAVSKNGVIVVKDGAKGKGKSMKTIILMM